MVTERKQCVITISNFAIIRKINVVSFKDKRTMTIMIHVENDLMIVRKCVEIK